MARSTDLTKGNITRGLWGFALPLMLGNVLQQLYNLVDTWVVGRYVGDNALAAVGSSYTLMTFLTSVIIGLCLGSSSFVSMAYGRKDVKAIRNGIFLSSSMIGAIAVVIMALFYILVDKIILLLQVPYEIAGDMKEYLIYVFIGFIAIYIYNYVSNILRGIGNSVVPLVFLSVSVVLNIFLDILFVAGFNMGIKGAAAATVIAQYISGIGIFIYMIAAYPEYRIHKDDMQFNKENITNIFSLSGFTCLQQSVMNFGILCVQGIVNSFGTVIMAAFAVAVKIDTIAYMPVQDFGNAFSVFVAQNYGAGQRQRIKKGIKQSVVSVIIFCMCISAVVCGFADTFMGIFVDNSSVDVINAGAVYLRIEGTFYIGIGILFMLYGYYRAINKPMMSVVLTVISLGTRVVLAYTLSGISAIGVIGIWVAIPIGWFLADAAGQIIKSKPDLVLLDINIPELNGELVLRKLRKEADIPVIMVTSRTSESDEVLSMSYGADDYITKPYNPTILMLRISAVIKRTRKQDSSEADTGEKGIYQYRQAAVNTAKGTLSRGEKELVLTKNEMIIFLSLLNNIGKIVSRDELMTALWDNEEYINDNALTVNISRLRAKLSDFGYEDAIETRKKQGYCLV